MDIKSNKGISMVELIVTVAIIGIITAPISLVFITSYTNFISESDKATAEQCAREVLYGKGITSYGVIGDLERSNAKGSEIVIGDGTTTTASSISIPYTDDKGYKGNKEYSLVNGVMNFKDYTTTTPEDFYKDDKANGKDIKITDFVAGIKKKGSVTNADMIEVSVTVETGKSGPIKLESSYRINVED